MKLLQCESMLVERMSVKLLALKYVSYNICMYMMFFMFSRTGLS